MVRLQCNEKYSDVEEPQKNYFIQFKRWVKFFHTLGKHFPAVLSKLHSTFPEGHLGGVSYRKKKTFCFVISRLLAIDFEPFIRKTSGLVLKTAIGTSRVTSWGKTVFLRIISYFAFSHVEQKLRNFLAKFIGMVLNSVFYASRRLIQKNMVQLTDVIFSCRIRMLNEI